MTGLRSDNSGTGFLNPWYKYYAVARYEDKTSIQLILFYNPASYAMMRECIPK